MAAEPIDDIVAWSKTLSPWRLDCLRRLATSNDISDTDQAELLAMVKKAAGFALATQPPAAVPFEKAHYAGGKQQPLALKAIKDVQARK